MTDLGIFAAGFIVGGVVMGFLVPLLFMWREDDAPCVRAQNDEMPTSDTSSSGVGRVGEGE